MILVGALPPGELQDGSVYNLLVLGRPRLPLRNLFQQRVPGGSSPPFPKWENCLGSQSLKTGWSKGYFIMTGAVDGVDRGGADIAILQGADAADGTCR